MRSACEHRHGGQNYGLTLLSRLPLLVPVLIVNQEMVARLGRLPASSRVGAPPARRAAQRGVIA
jgi:hypothetical protein